MNRGTLNKQAALSNIILKKEILQSWCVSLPHDSAGKAEYFPATIRQFNAWDLSQNSELLRSSLPSINRNANGTLNNYPATRAELVSVIALLKSHAKKKIDKSSRIVRLAEKIRDLEMYIHVLEVELITLRVEYNDWNQRTIASNEKYEALLSEFHYAQALAQKAQTNLNRQNAELKSALGKVSGLQVILDGPHKS